VQLDEDLAQQLLVVRALLLRQRAVELFLLDQAFAQQELAERFSLQGRDHLLTHRLQSTRQIRVALKPVLQPRDLQNLVHVLLQVHELDLAEEVFAAAFEPQQGLEPFAVDESRPSRSR
jgi:hypothetical protein